ncbi:sodium/calcium exchanger Calx-like [Convolutriloba macropyga]|uniref:sodium/calcium exchanger Calx-like n=1 Tax=Convolutriloba macropyga TaxID=536237 RepID=UPI003F527995
MANSYDQFPGEYIQKLEIELVNDEVYEDEEFFGVTLLNLTNSRTPLSPIGSGGTEGQEGATGQRRSRRSHRRSKNNTASVPNDRGNNELDNSGLPCVLGSGDDEARVIILDDDHRGIFAFEFDQEEVAENEHAVMLKVQRYKGARGVVEVPYTTDEFTAIAGKDFKATNGVLRFEDNEVVHEIIIPVMSNRGTSASGDRLFHVRLSDPVTITTDEERYKDKELSKKERAVDMKGEARLGVKVSCLVSMVEVRRLGRNIQQDINTEQDNDDNTLNKITYKDQFREAACPQGEFDDETGEYRKPTTCTWIIHVIACPWKLGCAFIPPPGWGQGWPCFLGALGVIGLLTWLMELVATCVGCAAGVKDIVTANTLVALGTSLPDTFASFISAQHDEDADNAIGNVTGSNAVNVFLGMGLAWLIASIAQAARGCTLAVEPLDLAFYVVVFTILIIFGICIVIYRRFNRNIGVELGGPMKCRIISAVLLIILWVTYLVVTSLAAYNLFPVF